VPYASEGKSLNKRKISTATAIGVACLTLAGCVIEGGSYRGSDRLYYRGGKSDPSAAVKEKIDIPTAIATMGDPTATRQAK